MSKSIIISYRESSSERKFNLMCVLDYLSYIQDNHSEIILIEQDSESKINWLDDVRGNQHIKHIFVKNPGVFNKGWGYNIGAKIAKTNILIFHDSDMFLKPQTYNIAVNSLNAGNDIVNPYRSVVFLDKPSSKEFKKHKYSFAVTNKFKPLLHTVISGGIFLMKKDKFLELKGFDEECYGYGHEDDIFDEKVKKLGLSLFTINDISIHIYHESHTNNSDLYYSFMEVNKEMFAEYVSMNKQQLSNKIDSVEVWGDETCHTSEEVSVRHVKREVYERLSENLVEHILSKFTDDFMDEIVSDVSTKVYNDIVDTISEKVKQEMISIKYTDKEKTSLLREVMKKFKG